MSTISTAITTIASTDTVSASRSTINTNTALRHSMNIRELVDADMPYTPIDGDDLISVTTTAAVGNINLPVASAWANRSICVYLKYDAGGGVNINANGSDTISGSASVLVANRYDAVRMISNGSNAWYIIASIP